MGSSWEFTIIIIWVPSRRRGWMPRISDYLYLHLALSTAASAASPISMLAISTISCPKVSYKPDPTLERSDCDHTNRIDGGRKWTQLYVDIPHSDAISNRSITPLSSKAQAQTVVASTRPMTHGSK
ncbi:hypothetical protein ElyMa_004202600 [Elysia marginata]|uniref:Uncharacterized protein n=1 Tax=Elysia marginata TaxID=1093978 RepID=A0AAV4GMA7_9GAST|nr:hypothetical protein ElyMa_004202600 [Elysia marginata]